MRASPFSPALGLLCLLLWLYLLGAWLYRRRAYGGWQSWPKEEATVDSVAVGGWLRGNPPLFSVTIFYSYVVNGDDYSGSCEACFAKESDADDYTDGIQGRKVSVRVHPEDHERSKLEIEAAGLKCL
jgi:hypothetical protein